MIRIRVPGVPVPKGSLRHVGKGRMVDQTNVKPWMAKIRAAALAETGGQAQPVVSSPCRVAMTFWFPRPVAAKNRLYPHVRSTGDIDKLARAVLDALQPAKVSRKKQTRIEPGILADDSLVVQLKASKEYVQQGEPRVEITITEM